MEKTIETERLYLRKMTEDDFDDLCVILKDADVMYAYEHAFSDEEVREWLDRQLGRYAQYGFGLWGVILKETETFIGQCGITMQETPDGTVPEIGYLFAKNTGAADMRQRRRRLAENMHLIRLDFRLYIR